MDKAILIDMGDTIIHNYDIDYKRGLSCVFDLAYNKTINKNYYIDYGIKVLDDIFLSRGIVEFKMIDFLKQINDNFKLKFDISYEKIEEVFAFNSSKYKYVNNIELFLKYLKQKNYKVIILSNTSFSKNIIFKTLGNLNQYFDDIILSSEYSLRKPHFSFFNVGITRLNTDKDKIYYIGNSFYYDVYGSYNSGIKSIWFNEENIRKDDKIIADYKEINSYIQLIEEDF